MMLETEIVESQPSFNPQARAPFFEALRDYLKKDMVAFHTPGHKYGAGIDPEFLDLVGRNVFRIDLCELPEVDNLHDPEHVLKEAMELAAQAYGVDESYFIINGSTCGNNTMVLSVCDPGEKILIPRNVHKSVISGILLSGAIPVYITPTWDKELGIDHNVTPEDVEAALIRHPDVKGLLIVNPTYYGVTCDVRTVAEICHRHGKPLLVDEAHGPHLHFHPQLPVSAVDAGADLVVQSTHKIIAGMTQTSMFHVRHGRVNLDRVRKILQLLQSTSPNYVLMASLDTARRQMALHGRQLLTHAIEISEWARAELNKIPGVYCFGRERVGFPGFFNLDLTKLTINVSHLGISGFDCLDLLNERYGIQSEMATLTNVLEIVTFANTRQDMERLVEAMRSIATEIHNKGVPRQLLPLVQQMDLPPLPEAVLTPREAFYARTERVPFEKSAGRICTEIVSPYPPGIPILVPGERITQELVEYIKLVYRHGGFINGPEDIRLHTIKVVA
ncbi:MAG: arginine decarboxylase [Candidatus Melainabacteria bacterium HGW-Melainabacteria-1]|nr:MAG: arginine decarboxylase [Candidatus Melainabacteria bacterium HGW-Melainabacteria-1]